MSSVLWRHVVGLERMTSHVLPCDVMPGRIHYLSSVNGDMWSWYSTRDVTRPWSDVMYSASRVHDVTCLRWCAVIYVPVFFTLEQLQLPLNQCLVQSPVCADGANSEIDRQCRRADIAFSPDMFTVGAPYLYYHTRTHRICRYLSHLWTTFHLQLRHSS